MKYIVIIAIVIGINGSILKATTEIGYQPRIIVSLEHDEETKETAEGYPMWLEKAFYGGVIVVGAYLTWRFGIKKLDIYVGRWKTARVERQSLAKHSYVDLQKATFPLFEVKKGGNTHYLLATSSDLAININDLPDNSLATSSDLAININDLPPIVKAMKEADLFVTPRVDRPWLGQLWHNFVVHRRHRKFAFERNNQNPGKPKRIYLEREVEELRIINDASGKTEEKTLKEKLDAIASVLHTTDDEATELKALLNNDDMIKKLREELDSDKYKKFRDELGGNEYKKLKTVLAELENKDGRDEIVKKIIKARNKGKELFNQLTSDLFNNLDLDEDDILMIRPTSIFGYLHREGLKEAFRVEPSTILMEEQLTRRGRKLGKEIVNLSSLEELWEAELLAIEEKNLIKKVEDIITLLEKVGNQDIVSYASSRILDARRTYLKGEIEETLKHLNLELSIKRSLAKHEQINLGWLGKKHEYLFNELRRQDISINDDKDKLGVGSLKLDKRRVQSVFSDNVLLYIKGDIKGADFISDVFNNDESFVTDNKWLIESAEKEIVKMSNAQAILNKKIALLEELLDRYYRYDPDEIDGLIKKSIMEEKIVKSLEEASDKDLETVVEGIRTGRYWQKLTEIVNDANNRWEAHDRSLLIDCLNNNQKTCFVYLDIAHFSFPNIKDSKYAKKGWYPAENHSLLKLLEAEGFKITPVDY